ncbi:hypothetical protein [Novosphingobium lentum]|uniref:hypothetical protein n=1 Tax=Novosphingobium lentum TaxID=145287 RepID=UPI000833EAAD|nr:hypothetical protein [Novosphingobium lentum]
MQRNWEIFGWRISPLFIVTVLIPTAIAFLYFGVFASDIYISESKFVVRSPDKPSVGGVGILLKTAGFSNANDELYAAHEYIRSRDALRAIDDKSRFRGSYSMPNISAFDRFGGLGVSSTFEDLYKYFRGKVSVNYDATSSVTTLSVRAYNPKDSQYFNERLLEMAEQTVNRMNTRGRADVINNSQVEVDNAKIAARNAAAALARYRNRSGVVDPEKQAGFQLQMVSKLQDELIANRTQVAELRNYAPDNPQIPALRARIASLEEQIDTELGKVTGSRRSLAGEIEVYQGLMLESQYSDKRLAAAMASLQEAESEARRKQAYVERIVQPNRPDSPLEPRRWAGILATFVIGMVAWGILSLLLAGVREHQL